MEETETTSWDVEIPTFINPHFFFIVPKSERQVKHVHDISERIKKAIVVEQNYTECDIDEMVAVRYHSEFKRGYVKLIREESNSFAFFVWLLEEATLIKTDKVYKIPHEIKKVTCHAVQASLKNFCYIQEVLELGVTGHRKKNPTVLPNQGICNTASLLLCDAERLVFKASGKYKNILIGEIVIHKQGKVIELSDELFKLGLLMFDEEIFLRIIYSASQFLNHHLELVYQHCKSFEKHSYTGSISSPMNTVVPIGNSIPESGFKSEPLENGRKGKMAHSSPKINFSTTSESEDDKHDSTIKKLNKLRKNLEKESSFQTHTDNNYNQECLSSRSKVESYLETLPDSNKFAGICNVKENTMILKDTLEVSPDDKKENSPSNSVKSVSRTAILLQQREQKLKEQNLKKDHLNVLAEIRKKNTQGRSPKEDSTNTEVIQNVKSSRDNQKRLAALRLKRQNQSGSDVGLDSTIESSFEDDICHENLSMDTSSEFLDNEKPQDSNESISLSEVSLKSANTSMDTSMKSPFADITSKKSTKPNKMILMPAGMERNMKVDVKTRVTNHRKLTKQNFKKKSKPSESNLDDSDCPTIKVEPVKRKSDEESLVRTEKEEKEPNVVDSGPPPVKLSKQELYSLLCPTGCTCFQCKMTMEDDMDDNWESGINFGQTNDTPKRKRCIKPKGTIIKPQKLLKDSSDEGASSVKILSINYNSMKKHDKQVHSKLLVHGESLPTPINMVSNININREIYNNISRINYKEAKKIQKYAFPAITRNQHVFMVNDHGSGKTMAYLPILSSFIMDKNERYEQLFKMGGGPFVIILCSNSRKCEEIYDLARTIFDRQRNRISLVTYPGHGNISNVDMLITIPVILHSLLSSNAINFKRLCHFVLEDADVILKSHQELLYTFLDLTNKMLDHRHCPKTVQLIACAERWTFQLENLMKKLRKVPLVCIGNYLEAALYGKMNFTTKFLDTACKEVELKNKLSDVYKFTKSVVLCSAMDTEIIHEFLMLKGINSIAITNEMTLENILDQEEQWNNALPGNYTVLICSDEIYNNHLTVTNASLLIHYSLPSSWTQFVKRFSSLLENLTSPLNTEQKKMQISSIVFIDESCKVTISKLSNFIRISGFQKQLPDTIRLFFEQIAMEQEQSLLVKNVEFCEDIKIFGKCFFDNCRKRHILDKDTDISNFLPRNGIIKFKIVKMTHATTCSIKLLECYDLNGKSIKKYEDYTDEISDVLDQMRRFHSLSKVVENHLYLHEEDGKYFRCRLIKKDDDHLVIFLIDRGIYQKSYLDKLFKMPDKLKEIPPQCCEAYLANLIPPYQDTKFSKSAHRKAQFLVDSNCPDSVMSAVVLLQVTNNLWLGDVCEEREMYDKSLPTTGFQLTRELVIQGIAAKSEQSLNSLYKICTDAGINLPEVKVNKPKIVNKIIEQIKPQWAHLDVDNIHEVIFSCAISPTEFYVRNKKFEKQLEELEKDVQEEIRKPYYPVPRKIETGKFYLVLDDKEKKYSRGLVLNMNDHDAHIFFVDYGDEAVVPFSNLKHLSNEFISRLPFQSIKCSLYGIRPIDDDWPEEAINLMYDRGFEPNTDIFRPLFVKIYFKEINHMISRQNSYAVVMKDGYCERHILVNDLLIECGFALPDGNAIEDFEIPEVKQVSFDDEIEDVNAKPLDQTNEILAGNWEEMEIHGIENFLNDDMKTFLKGMGWLESNTEYNGSKAKLESEKKFTPMKAAVKVDYFTPLVVWSETEKNVRIQIQIPDVEDYKAELKQSRMFLFSTTKNEKVYKLNLVLYEKVESNFEKAVLGSHVRIAFSKINKVEWPRLVYSQEKNKKISYDVSTIKDDEKPRKFLQLDIEDASSTDSENNNLGYYFDCSDRDSEYDDDIPNDTYYNSMAH